MTRTSGDVIVVGGGVVGTSIAYELSRRGLNVTIMDGTGLGSGSSGHGHGSLHLAGRNFPTDDFFSLARFSSSIYPSFVEGLLADSGIDPLYHELPGLFLALDDEEVRTFRGVYEKYRTQIDVRWIDGEECQAIEPRVNKETIAGLVQPSGQVDAYLMCLAGAAAVEHHGGRVLNQHATGLLKKKNRIVGVEHEKGSIEADIVVLSMGAWSWFAGSWVGFPVPVRPLHGELVHARLPGEPFRAFIMSSKHGCVLPRRDGLLLVGATGGNVSGDKSAAAAHGFDPLDPTPPSFLIEPRPGDREIILEGAVRLVPSLDEANVVNHLFGIRPLSADGMPIIGPAPGLDGLFLATGHGTKGIHLSPATAMLTADYIVNGSATKDVPSIPFLPDRFMAA